MSQVPRVRLDVASRFLSRLGYTDEEVEAFQQAACTHTRTNAACWNASTSSSNAACWNASTSSSVEAREARERALCQREREVRKVRDRWHSSAFNLSDRAAMLARPLEAIDVEIKAQDRAQGLDLAAFVFGMREAKHLRRCAMMRASAARARRDAASKDAQRSKANGASLDNPEPVWYLSCTHELLQAQQSVSVCLYRSRGARLAQAGLVTILPSPHSSIPPFPLLFSGGDNELLRRDARVFQCRTRGSSEYEGASRCSKDAESDTNKRSEAEGVWEIWRIRGRRGGRRGRRRGRRRRCAVWATGGGLDRVY